jgi:hypothetical protein
MTCLRPIPPAEVVRRVFTRAEIANGCGINESTVWRWGRPRPKGTGGVVPGVHHLSLLQLARELGRKLTADDLVLGRHK